MLVDLAARVRAAGLFESCARRYRRRLLVLVPAFAASWWLAWAAPTGGAIAAAIVAGVLAVQLGIVAHDAGHHAVDRRGWVNELCGQLGMSLVNGLGFRFWRRQHDAHHRHCQIEDHDPDLDYALLFSVFPRAVDRRRGWARRAQRWQAYYFWLLGAVGYPYALRWRSVRNLAVERAATRWERWALAGHVALWLVVPALVAGPAAALRAYAIMSLVVGALLTLLFSVNHMGMPTMAADARASYLRRQVETSRNLETNAVGRLLFAGLDHQIEHHLFPTIGAAHLPAVRRLVEPVCRRHGIGYHAVGVVRAQREVLSHLDAMGRLAS